VLTDYLAQTRRLLQNPPAPVALYSIDDLTSYINTARGQLAGESQSVRVYATLAVTAGTRVYNFSAIDTSSNAGVDGVYNIKQAQVGVGDGNMILYMRSFPWFNQYLLNEIVPQEGRPVTWSQYGQGENGSIYLHPIPDSSYTLNLDCVCIPVDLVTDATAEAIPFPWTDCVPYFAAYMAFMSAQRQTDAKIMMDRYEEFVNRARRIANPTVLPFSYEQANDPTRQNKLGLGDK
jgi:hypothetical protein